MNDEIKIIADQLMQSGMEMDSAIDEAIRLSRQPSEEDLRLQDLEDQVMGRSRPYKRGERMLRLLDPSQDPLTGERNIRDFGRQKIANIIPGMTLIGREKVFQGHNPLYNLLQEANRVSKAYHGQDYLKELHHRVMQAGRGRVDKDFGYESSFSDGGQVFASDTDKIAQKLMEQGLDRDTAMAAALRMAQSRQQADQSILGGVPTQPPVSDVPPATEILGGDPSKLFQRQPTTMERIKDLPKDVLGAADAMASMGSLAALAVPSMLYALRPGQKTQGDPMEFALRNMYMPRSERGPSHLAGLGEVLESLPQTGPLPELQAFTGVGRGVGRQLTQKARQAGEAMAPKAADIAENILSRQGLLMQAAPSGPTRVEAAVPQVLGEEKNVGVMEPLSSRKSRVVPTSQSNQDIQPIETVQLPDGRFATTTQLSEVKQIRTGYDVADSPAAVAHITAGLRKSPQEQLVAVVVDENNRPLQIIRHTIGLSDQASAEPWSLVGSISNVPGAKAFYLSHNHPSGVSTLSNADVNLAKAIQELTRDTDLEMRGILAIGGNKFAFNDLKGGSASELPIPARARNKTVQMMERTFKRIGVLDKNAIGSPAEAARLADQIAGDQTGVLLFNSQLRPVGFVPIDEATMGQLRKSGQARRLYEAIERANAPSVMLVSKKELNPQDVANVSTMFSKAGSRVVDIMTGPDRKSMAMSGNIPQLHTFKAIAPVGVSALAASQEQEESFKKGGSVNHKAVASARRALEKAMAKGGEVKMGTGGSMLGRAAKAGAKRSAKARNKTTLPQEVLSQEETAENLRRFLDQSQVKDRLYHATPKDFKEFKPGGEDPTLSGPAIWLSTDPTNQPAMHNISAGRAGEFREGTNVMPVYAQAKNPLVLDDPVMIDWAQAVFAGGSREFPELIAPKWAEEIRKEGYDSILFLDPRRTGQTHEVIMFEPNKIKSAIGNRGTFDTREADITKRKGGLAALRK